MTAILSPGARLARGVPSRAAAGDRAGEASRPFRRAGEAEPAIVSVAYVFIGIPPALLVE